MIAHSFLDKGNEYSWKKAGVQLYATDLHWSNMPEDRI
jgi:hypothetical protein